MGTATGRASCARSSRRSRRRATATGGWWRATTARATRRAAILAAFRDEQGAGRVEIRDGPRRGFAANYLAPRRRPGDPRRLLRLRRPGRRLAPRPAGARSRAPRARLPADRPGALRRRAPLIDEAGRETGRSRHFRAAPGFANALVQSIAGGNTMLFDAAAKGCWRRARPAAVVAHDWWIYILVSGAGGTGDLRPRAHGALPPAWGNLIGGNLGLGARLARLRMLARRAGSPSTAT